MKQQAVKGTFDILPADDSQWQWIIAVAREVFARANVKPITTPIFEHQAVFAKSAGESSDLVVKKEMYTFTDAGDRQLTLRPEFTAGVVRAFIEHGMHNLPVPVKLWSYGPIFRAEKPQRGRFRQFHQINCEFFGLDTPLIDAEAIALLYRLLTTLGLKNLVVKLGSVGQLEERKAYNDYLVAALASYKADLSEDSQLRLELNPLRILDSKDAKDQAIVATLKRPFDFFSEDTKNHYAQVAGYLEAWQIPFEQDMSIVRGLDYYCLTAFEIHDQSIGAQSALCGGGRYDGLVELMGGKTTPGIGWAVGIERVLDALAQQEEYVPPLPPQLDVFFVPMDAVAIDEVAALTQELRRDFRVAHAYVKRNPGKGLRDANRANALYAALRGEQEREQDAYQVKNLQTGEQVLVKADGLESFLKDALRNANLEKNSSL